MLKNLWGLPAHPVFVHFPIAFFLLSGFLLSLYLLDGERRRINRVLKKLGLGDFDFEAGSFLSVVFGFGMGIVAVMSGLALVGGWGKLPVPHGLLGLATLTCYFVIMVIRWVFGPSLYGRPLRFLYYGLHIVGIALVVLTGHEGAELHYS